MSLYLWRFVASVDAKGAVRGYYLQTVADEKYLLHKNADKTDLALSNYKTYFRIVYTDTCWNIIGLNDRVLGYSSSTEKSYKAYKKDKINPYFIQLYRVKQDMDTVYSDYSMVCPKADTPSAVDVQPSVLSDMPQKLLDGNQVVILREGMRYNLLGKRLGR